MFGRLRNSIKCKHFVGVSFTSTGVAVASVSSRARQNISIDNVSYFQADSDAEKIMHVKNWIKAGKIKSEQINFVVPQKEIQLVLTEAAQVDQNELAKAMQWKLKDLIDLPAEQAVVEYLPIAGQTERGRQPMVYVISSSKQRLKEYVRLLEHEHLSLYSIDIPEMVNRNVASFLPEDQHGVGFISFEEKTGLLTLCRQEELYLARQLDTGYAAIKHELEKEELVNETLDQVVLEVQRSMDYYERYFAQPPIQSLVLAPTPVVLPGAPEYLAEQLGMAVRSLDLSECFTFGDEVDRTVQANCLSAIGAAIRWPLAA